MKSMNFDNRTIFIISAVLTLGIVLHFTGLGFINGLAYLVANPVQMLILHLMTLQGVVGAL